MGKMIDMIGKTFNNWTVLERDYNYPIEHNIKNPSIYYKCKCKCGTIKTVLGTDLRRGKNTSCGCLKRQHMQEKFYKLIGQRINNVVIIGIDEEKTKQEKRTYYKCQCDCGNIFSVSCRYLKENKCKYCPECARKNVQQVHFKDLTGQTFGELYVEKFLRFENHYAIFLCKCSCGNYKEVIGSYLTLGETMSCGCIKSKGEKKIRTLLSQNNIYYETEKIFPDCIFEDTKCHARFDFYIENNFLVEFDGEQHFSYSISGWNNKETFEKNKKHDNYKNEWCKNHNILLKRIPYWEINNITIDKIMDKTSFIVSD